MEFEDFCKNRKRMCKRYECGSGCPLHAKELPDRRYATCEDWCLTHDAQAEKIVHYWAENNPFVTNAEKFKEVFGRDIDYSFDHPGYLFISKLIEEASLDKVGDIQKWLESEYIAPNEE